MILEVTKTCTISNVYDLIKVCELRDDMQKIVIAIDNLGFFEELKQFFNNELYNADDIYDYFLEQGDEKDIAKELDSLGYINFSDYFEDKEE